MKIIKDKIKIKELEDMAEDKFGDFVKAVVDIEKEIMAVDAGLHSDEEALLLDSGSRQNDLWGINIYPNVEGEGFIEFDSMINVRPAQENFSRSVENEEIQEKILKVVDRLVKK